MSQCVPNWDVDDACPTRFDLRPHPSTSSSSAPYVPMLDYEMAELTWENGQLSMHGLGLRRLSGKPDQKYGEWEKPRAAAAGTLESIVNLATQKPAAARDDDVDDIVPCFGGRSNVAQHHQLATGGGGEAAAVDALVPCQAAGDEEGRRSADPRSIGVSKCVVVGSSTRVDSCSGAGAGACEATRAVVEDGDERSVRRKARLVPRVPVAGEWSKDQSVSVSGTFAGDSWHVPTVDTSELGGGVGFTSTTSFCSQGNTLSTSGRPSCTNNTTTVDDHDSVCHSRPQRETENEDQERKKGNSKSASSNRRSRAAAIHNQSERKRRDKINQRMKTLQKLVPNSNKTDKASMLDEVIDYLKQLQAQVHMMSRMSIPSMMMPQLAIQQQLQMSMMAAAAPMGMGMGFGMGMGMAGMAAMPIPPASIGAAGMDMNINHINMNMNMNIPPMARQAAAAAGGLPQPAAFMPPLAAAWDVSNAAAATTVVPTDPISTFLACQPQPVTVEAYSRMIAMIQQQQQQLTSTSKH